MDRDSETLPTFQRGRLGPTLAEDRGVTTMTSISPRSKRVSSQHIASAAAGGRGAHPAGSCRCPNVLSPTALEVIAAGLAATAPAVSHSQQLDPCRRYTKLLDTPLYDAWLIEW